MYHLTYSCTKCPFTVDIGREPHNDLTEAKELLYCPHCKKLVCFFSRLKPYSCPTCAGNQFIGSNVESCPRCQTGTIYQRKAEDLHTCYIKPYSTVPYSDRLAASEADQPLFELTVQTIGDQRVIDFANHSKDFVEVVFTIDGQETKTGETYNPSIKGYAYPPKLHKLIKGMADGSPLPFSEHGGEVAAYIFAGIGQYKPEDIDKPPLLRQKISFKRLNDDPATVIKLKY